MQELIKVTQRAVIPTLPAVETIDARELYIKLDNARDFSTWIKHQIRRCKLVLGRDYSTFMGDRNGARKGRRRQEYALSVNAAKHICITAGTEQAKAIRQYLIDRDARLTRIEAGVEAPPVPPTASQPFKLPQSYAEALRELAGTVEALEAKTQEAKALTAKVEEQAPAVEAYRGLCESDGAVDTTAAAKVLGCRRIDLRDMMIEAGMIYQRRDVSGWCGKFQALQAGWLTNKVSKYTPPGSKRTHAYVKVLITPKGLAYLRKRMGTGEVDNRTLP